MSCNLTEFGRIFGSDSEAILSRISALPRRSNISIINTLERIRKSYSLSENDLKRDKTLTKSFLRKESKLPMLLEQFFKFTV